METTRKLIYDLDLPDLKNQLEAWGQPAYRAVQIWQGLYKQFWSASEQFTSFEPREYFANGGSVAVRGYEACIVKATGKPVGTDWMMLFRVDNGMITEWQTHVDTEAYASAHRK